MSKIKTTPNIELIENLDKLSLQIDALIYLYEENRQELIRRFPFLENYEEFKEKYKIIKKEDTKIYHL